MAKAKGKKPSVKVNDLSAKKNPKGGLNFTTQLNQKAADGSVAPSPELNFNTWAGKKV